jgi:hypothetical protein
MKINIAILFLLFCLSISAKAQNDNEPNSAIQMIDSLKATNHIEFCRVARNDTEWGNRKYRFRFQGNYLIVEIVNWRNIKEAYYNMDKLVSFYVDGNCVQLNFAY